MAKLNQEIHVKFHRYTIPGRKIVITDILMYKIN